MSKRIQLIGLVVLALMVGLTSCEGGLEQPLTNSSGEQSLGLIATLPGIYCGEFGPAAECPVEGQTIEDRDDNIKASVLVSPQGEYIMHFDSGEDNIFQDFEMDFTCQSCEHEIPDSDEYNGLVFSPAHSSGSKRLYIGLKKGQEYYGFVGFANGSCNSASAGQQAK